MLEVTNRCFSGLKYMFFLSSGIVCWLLIHVGNATGDSTKYWTAQRFFWSQVCALVILLLIHVHYIWQHTLLEGTEVFLVPSTCPCCTVVNMYTISDNTHFLKAQRFFWSQVHALVVLLLIQVRYIWQHTLLEGTEVFVVPSTYTCYTGC